MNFPDAVGHILIGWSALSLLIGLGWSCFMKRLVQPPAKRRDQPPAPERPHLFARW